MALLKDTLFLCTLLPYLASGYGGIGEYEPGGGGPGGGPGGVGGSLFSEEWELVNVTMGLSTNGLIYADSSPSGNTVALKQVGGVVEIIFAYEKTTLSDYPTDQGVTLCNDAVLAVGKLDAVDVFFRNENNVWTLNQTVDAPVASSNFGTFLSCHNNVLLVGADGENQDSGRAYVFRNNGLGTTFQLAITIDPPVGAGGSFGTGVATNGEIIAIADLLSINGSDNAGSVHIYEGSASNWSSTPSKIEPPVPKLNGRFGADGLSKLAIVDGTVVATEAGAESVYAFEKDEFGSFEATLLNFTGGASDVIISGSGSGDRVLVMDTVGLTIEVFKHTGAFSWSLVEDLTRPVLIDFGDPSPPSDDAVGVVSKTNVHVVMRNGNQTIPFSLFKYKFNLTESEEEYEEYEEYENEECCNGADRISVGAAIVFVLFGYIGQAAAN